MAWRRLLPVAIALMAAVSVPAVAGAEETQISTDLAAPDAQGPWVSWRRDGAAGVTHLLWRAGVVRPFPNVASLQLGSERNGRTVAIYRRFSGWPARERLLPRGPTRWLLPNSSRFVNDSVDKFRGTIAVRVQAQRGPGARIYVRRPGGRRFVRVVTAEAGGFVEAGREWLAYREFDLVQEVSRLRAINFTRRRAKPVTLTSEDESDYGDCGHDFNCNPPRRSGPSFSDFEMDSRYVYWLGTVNRDGPRIFRVDLRDFWPEEFAPERTPTSFAVGGGGRIVYSASGGGIYTVDRPRWRTSEIAVPAEG